MHDLVLIGGAGFIGRNILDAMDDPAFAALRPAVIDDFSGAAAPELPAGLPLWRGRYQDRGALRFLEALGEAPRTLVLLAGETRVKTSRERPLDFVAANVSEPAAFAFAALRPGDHLMLFSTAGALYDGTAPITPDLPVSPKNVYGATKAAEELVLEQIAALRGARMTALRPSNVFGPHSARKQSAVHVFIRRALAGEPVTVHGDGGQRRDFVFARDLGRAVAALALAAASGAPIAPSHVLASGRSITLEAVLDALETVHGAPVPRNRVAAEALLATEPRDVLVTAEALSPALRDAQTSFDAALRATYDWYAAGAGAGHG